MAKIYVDCDDAIKACEKSIENLANNFKNNYKGEPEYEFRALIDHDERLKKIVNLMRGAAYLKYKDRRLILDTQSEEFSLISGYLLEE